MLAEMTKASNKTTKRKNRNKRRKQQKQQKSISSKQNLQHHCHFQRHGQNRGQIQWRETYEAAVRWHCNHQMNFWRQRAEQLQQENECLKRKESTEIQNSVREEYETSSDEEEDELQQDEASWENYEQQEDVDADYLKFLAVTRQHREELRLAREQSEAESTL